MEDRSLPVSEQDGNLFMTQEAAEQAWLRERGAHQAADKALQVLAGFLASRRRWRWVSVRKVEAELERAVQPLAEALKTEH